MADKGFRVLGIDVNESIVERLSAGEPHFFEPGLSDLVKEQPSGAHILIDQGEADQFLGEQLKPELFAVACADSGQKLTLRRQPGYDHSYWFIASFMDDHLRHHADVLKA